LHFVGRNNRHEKEFYNCLISFYSLLGDGAPESTIKLLMENAGKIREMKTYQSIDDLLAKIKLKEEPSLYCDKISFEKTVYSKTIAALKPYEDEINPCFFSNFDFYMNYGPRLLIHRVRLKNNNFFEKCNGRKFEQGVGIRIPSICHHYIGAMVSLFHRCIDGHIYIEDAEV
jgi:hypothetical protein